MTARRPCIAGNWKMNTDRDAAVALAESLATQDSPSCELVVAPPYPFLHPVGEALRGSAIELAGQDVFYESAGAWTGAVSAAMLRSVGCSHVIVGHSERRLHFGETDETVNRRVRASLDEGLIAIICVGESLQERELDQTLDVVTRQLRSALSGIPHDGSERFLVAYEPVWAIGTGHVATPEQAQEVHAAIRAELASRDRSLSESTRILYGGSVKPGNAAALFAQPDVDGGLVGGASLDGESFLAIARAAE